MTGWEVVDLGQVVEILSSKRVFANDYVAAGVPFWRGKEIVELSAGRSITTELFISEKTYESLGRKIGFPKTDDILLTSVGTLGRAYKLNKSDRIYFKDGNLTWFRNYSERLDPSWLLYWMRSDVGQTSFERTKIGSTQQALTIVNLKSLKVALPPLPEQREIAAILGALDDKIEVNRKTAAVLEEMARALYRSWFVDFDPVWAKAEGRPPAHMDAATAALFPDGFDDAGLPLGWQVSTIGDVARSAREGADPSYIDPKTPYIGLEHIPRRSIAITDWGVADDVGSTKSKMRVGQFLFGKLRPYFHKVALVPVDGICSTDILVVEAKHQRWSEFVLSVISSVELVDQVNAASTGTRMPRAKWQDLADYRVALAPNLVHEAFSALVRPMHQKILTSVQENQTLATLRDSLLPRLMSGELRVGAAREMLDEVA